MSPPNDKTRALALDDLRPTIERVDEVLSLLRERGASRKLSIAPRQGAELARFLEVWAKRLRAGGVDEVPVPLLLTLHHEVESALQFFEQAFLGPRLFQPNQVALESADLLCVEGYLRFVDHPDIPIGPLVAVDARRMPAVWSADAILPLPSLLERQARPAEWSQRLFSGPPLFGEEYIGTYLLLA